MFSGDAWWRVKAFYFHIGIVSNAAFSLVIKTCCTSHAICSLPPDSGSGCSRNMATRAVVLLKVIAQTVVVPKV